LKKISLPFAISSSSGSGGEGGDGKWQAARKKKAVQKITIFVFIMPSFRFQHHRLKAIFLITPP
jgi:hypothetical protein